MSSVRAVPETQCMSGDDLSADDAWHALRDHGVWPLARESFVRFRYGDGFSHARGFGLQLALAAVPLIIAGAGLSAALGAESFGEVVARTVVSLSPGSDDTLVVEALGGDDGAEEVEEAGEVALTLGLLTAFAATTTAFAQLERGANRIYGTKRDRPALHKYLRAAVLSATAGVALFAGLILIVAGEPFGEAVEQVYDWGDVAEEAWDVVRWPAGLTSLVIAVTMLFKFAPRRQQPGVTWLGVGGVATVVGWMAASGLLALYVTEAQGFGATYGPLTAIMALLLWANMTGVALLGGVALAAQLEAVRAGIHDPLLPDADDDGIPDALDEHPESGRG